MKLVCTKEALNHAVQTVQKAVSSKNTLPILTGIYLSAYDGKLDLQATDYEIGISCKIDANIEEAGTVVVSGRYFQELVRKLPGETVEISSNREDRTIKITSNFSQFNLLSLPSEEFPVLKQMVSENSLLVKDNILKDLIKKTVFACATDESRPIFTGGLLEADAQGIRMIATNTHRLALKRDNLENLNNSLKIITPSKILTELARVLVSEIPVDVRISWQKNQVSFAFDDIYIISRLIEGQFPDYNRVIPASFATTVQINTDQFLDAVERVSLVAKDGEYNVVKFQFKADTVIITSNNPDVGMAYETVDSHCQGNEIEIAFNVKYVTDILKNVGSEKIIFSLNTPLSPASIKPEDDDNYTYIITPVRTN
ncbi:dna polymerase iii beta chain central [Lucifera butyrica]|uniref:Beta sliding clamp n=1 Tax=Lucifera butyrica TaxID=1351585 RepID=A0A498RE63_9FIRM|nr:DNA polymerase III subunit beta [Lucifera butyrica]VBB07478.1 dna polymerase iii beta chain central [Lucifera butyrica]